MSRNKFKFRHEFVEFTPDKISDGAIYISIPYATATHKCPCGCGHDVVTPLSPTDWSLIFDGVSVSLDPSIGNWSFACKSHYWIENNEVRWAKIWSEDKIETGRENDLKAKSDYYQFRKEDALRNDSFDPATQHSKTSKVRKKS